MLGTGDTVRSKFTTEGRLRTQLLGSNWRVEEEEARSKVRDEASRREEEHGQSTSRERGSSPLSKVSKQSMSTGLVPSPRLDGAGDTV